MPCQCDLLQHLPELFVVVIQKWVEVLPDRASEERRFLRDDCQARPEILQLQCSDIEAVKEDLPRCRLDEAEERKAEGGLPGPRSAADAYLLLAREVSTVGVAGGRKKARVGRTRGSTEKDMSLSAGGSPGA